MADARKQKYNDWQSKCDHFMIAHVANGERSYCQGQFENDADVDMYAERMIQKVYIMSIGGEHARTDCGWLLVYKTPKALTLWCKDCLRLDWLQYDEYRSGDGRMREWLDKYLPM